MSTIIRAERDKPSNSARIKQQLGYPVIDTDVHTIDFWPGLADYIDHFAGPAAADKFHEGLSYFGRSAAGNWYELTESQRRDFRAIRPPWWTAPARNTLDLATSALPSLLYERLDELGSDYAVLYPNLSIGAIFFADDHELRPLIAKAVNACNADLYRPYADRLTPVAVIPLNTPQEGIDALEHAVRTLGSKVALIPGSIRRPIKGLAEKVKDRPEVARKLTWLDSFGLDSEYDYDPFWAKAVELGVPLTTHSGSMGWDARASTSNFSFNHIGHFAQASDLLTKSLFFGGVTRRFPKLRVGLLEGGGGWGAQLYNDIVGHWEKRNGRAVQMFDPASIDRELLISLFREYGSSYANGRDLSDADILASVATGTITGASARHAENGVDDFAAADVSSVEDIRDRFVPNFYFGNEADDPTVAAAFNTKVNAAGAKLNVVWGSDSGHWDVPDQREVLAETWRLLEAGVLSEADLRDFLFAHPHEFYTSADPDFFEGTAIGQKLSRSRVA